MGTGASKRENSSEKLQEKKSLLKTLSGHTGGINCMDILDNQLLTGSDDRTARLWDLTTQECKVVLEGHRGYISCCNFWQDTYALTGSIDKTIRKWNTLSGNCVLKFEHHTGIINKMLIHGNFLFSSSYDSQVICWNLTTGEVRRLYRGHSKGVLPMLYVENEEATNEDANDEEEHSDSLITGSMDKSVKLWNVTSGTSLRTFRGHKGAVLCLAMDLGNNTLFTGSTDNTIRKWNLITGSALKVFKGHEGSVICLQMHHRLLYSASVDTTARCWVAEFGDTTRKYVGHDHMVADMKYYRGVVYTASGDCAVRAFDAKSGNLKRTFKGHKYPVNCLKAYYNTLLSGSYDGTVKIWNIKEFVQRDIGDSEMSIGSSVRSSASLAGRRTADTCTSESDVSIQSDKYLQNGRFRDDNFDKMKAIAMKDGIIGRVRKPRVPTGRVRPLTEKLNKNNNSNKNGDLDFHYITNKLQGILEDEDYWAGSSNQSSEINSSVTTPNCDFSTRNTSAYSAHSRKTVSESSDSSLPRNGGRGTHYLSKRSALLYMNKRPRTESSSISSNSEMNPDIALVDEELQIMSGNEISPSTSGYQTADNESPPTGSEKIKTRQKSSVSFSPTVSLRENSDRDSKSYRNSRIPTPARSRQTNTSAPGSRKNYPTHRSTSNA